MNVWIWPLYIIAVSWKKLQKVYSYVLWIEKQIMLTGTTVCSNWNHFLHWRHKRHLTSQQISHTREYFKRGMRGQSVSQKESHHMDTRHAGDWKGPKFQTLAYLRIICCPLFPWEDLQKQLLPWAWPYLHLYSGNKCACCYPKDCGNRI
jgi:hypothetical protein